MSILHADAVRFVTAWNAVQRQLNDNARAKGFWDPPEGIPQSVIDDPKIRVAIDAQKIALMHSELSEALEGLRKPGPDKHCPELDSVEVELADTVIRIMDFAQQRGLRVVEAIVAKATANSLREKMHGGKAF